MAFKEKKMKILSMMSVFSILFLASCSCTSDYNLRILEVGGKVWYECHRWNTNFDAERLALCDNVEECKKVCNDARTLELKNK